MQTAVAVSLSALVTVAFTIGMTALQEWLFYIAEPKDVGSTAVIAVIFLMEKKNKNDSVNISVHVKDAQVI